MRERIPKGAGVSAEAWLRLGREQEWRGQWTVLGKSRYKCSGVRGPRVGKRKLEAGLCRGQGTGWAAGRAVNRANAEDHQLSSLAVLRVPGSL